MGLFPRTVVSNPAGRAQGPSGQVFIVDYNEGSDSNSGTSKEKPLESIAAAVAKCGDAQGDTIYVTSQVHVEDLPIVIDVQGVTVIGVPGSIPTQQSKTWIYPLSDDPAFTLSAGDASIEGFMMWGGASGPCVNFGTHATLVRNVIRDCYFWSGTWGVQDLAAVNSPSHYLSIVGCGFGPSLTVGGICLRSNGSWPLIDNCFFEQTPGPQIWLTGSTKAGGRITNCLFSLDSDTAGEAITIGSGTRWVIAGNRANDKGITAMSAIPWVDSVGTNVWLDNYRCNAVVLPE